MVSKISAVAAKLTFVLALSFLGGQAMAAGALAVDSNQGDQYGFAHGQPNTSQAAQRALNECGSGCQVVLQFDSGCAAFAADQSRGSTANGWGTASSASGAQSRAVSECQSRRGSNCTIRSWACE